MMRTLFQLGLILLLVGGLIIGIVRADSAYSVTINQITFESDNVILIHTEAFGTVEAYATYAVELRKAGTDTTLTHNQYNVSLTYEDTKLTLRLLLPPTLPNG